MAEQSPAIITPQPTVVVNSPVDRFIAHPDILLLWLLESVRPYDWLALRRVCRRLNLVITTMFTHGEMALRVYNNMCASQLEFFRSMSPTANALPFHLVLKAHAQRPALVLATIDRVQFHAQEFWDYLFRGSTQFELPQDVVLAAMNDRRLRATASHGHAISVISFPDTHIVKLPGSMALRTDHSHCYCIGLIGNSVGPGTVVDAACFHSIAKRAVSAMAHSCMRIRISPYQQFKERTTLFERATTLTDRAITPLLRYMKPPENAISPNAPWMLKFMHLGQATKQTSKRALASLVVTMPAPARAPTQTWRSWMTTLPHTASNAAARFFTLCVRPPSASPCRARADQLPMYPIALPHAQEPAYAPAQQGLIGNLVDDGASEDDDDMPALEPDDGDDEDLARGIARDIHTYEQDVRRTEEGLLNAHAKLLAAAHARIP